MASDFDFELDGGAAPAPMFGTSEATPPEAHLQALTGAPPSRAEAEATLRELHDEYAQKLYAYTLSVLRSPQDAEDAVQTTFMNAFGSLQAGRLPRQRDSWLFRIAKNVCLNRIRTQQRKPAGTLDGIEVASLRTVDDAYEQRLHSFALRAALERLPEQQRKAIVMRELQGASYSEIADALGTTQGAVESLIFRARRQLSAALRSAGDGAAAMPHAA